MNNQPTIFSRFKALLKADFTVQLRRGRSGVLTIITPLALVLSLGNAAGKRGGDPFIMGVIAASLVVGLMGLCLAGYPVATAQDRAGGIFQRLRVTPTPVWAIMASRLLVQLLLVEIMTALVLGVAYWRFGTNLGFVHYIATIGATLFGGCAFLALGQMIVGLVRSTDAVNSTSRIVYILLTVGGLIGSLGNLGETVQKVVTWSPYGTTQTILQAALHGTAGVDHIWWSLLATIGYALIFAVIGIRYFSWSVE